MNTEAQHINGAFKAAQYVRMSTEHQQYSTQNQADKIQEYADKRGIEIVKTYADEGKSGLSIGGRAALQRLLAKRRDQGPKANNRPKLPNSAHSLVKTYQREVERQHKMVLKAEHAQQKLLLVEQGLRTLFTDTNFVTLLRAEGLETLPQYLAERIELNTLNGGVS